MHIGPLVWRPRLLIAERVLEVLEPDEIEAEPSASRPSFWRSLAIGAALAATLVAALTGSGAVLAALHGALERLVHLLA